MAESDTDMAELCGWCKYSENRRLDNDSQPGETDTHPSLSQLSSSSGVLLNVVSFSLMSSKVSWTKKERHMKLESFP